jgi:hypothetical protein
MSPPPTAFVLFARLCPPPRHRASLVAPPPLPPRQRLSHCASLAPAVGCCIVNSLAAPVPLVSCRRLSRCAATSLSRCAVTSLVAPPPLLPRRCHYCRANACLIAPLSRQWLVVASSPLSPRQCLSCRAGASLVAPPPLSLDAPSPLSLRRRLYRHAAATIVAPMPVSLRLSRASGLLLHCHLSRHASASLVVPAPLSLHRHLSCLSLGRGLSCGASPAPAGCRFTHYLNVPPSLLSRRLVVALLPLSLRRCLSLCHLSHCVAVSLSHRPSQPQ